MSPFEPFNRWLEYLESNDGRLFRRSQGEKETDLDLLYVIPPEGRIFTVGDLKALVNFGKEWQQYKNSKKAL